MDRHTAILNASIFRFNHLTMNPHTGDIKAHFGLTSPKKGTKRQQIISISAAKKATRGMKCVAAKNIAEWTGMKELAKARNTPITPRKLIEAANEDNPGWPDNDPPEAA